MEVSFKRLNYLKKKKKKEKKTYFHSGGMVLYKSLGRKGGVSTRLQKTSEDHLFHAAPVVQHWAKVHVVHCPISRLLRKTTRPKWGWKFIGHPKPFRRDISGLFVLDWRHHPAIFLQQLCTECT